MGASPCGHSLAADDSQTVASLEGATRSSMCRGLQVHPREGRLLLFFTRDADGQVDPYSWHGASAVGANGAPKFTAQVFKEVPPLPAELSTAGNLADEGFESYIQTRIMDF